MTARVERGQSRSLKSIFIDWRQDWWRAVIVTSAAFHDCSSVIEGSRVQWNQPLLTESKTGGGQSSISQRRFMTARMFLRAVDYSEITLCLLPIKISYKNILPSPIIKIRKRDCFKTMFQVAQAADLSKTELAWLPVAYDFTFIWHCTCVLLCKIDCQLHTSKTWARQRSRGINNDINKGLKKLKQPREKLMTSWSITLNRVLC